MGDPKGFLTTRRETPRRRPVDLRLMDWREVYEDFEPNKVPIILLVLLIVALVGYFGIYLPTRDDGDESPLGDVPGADEGSIGDAPTVSVAVALAEHHSYGITVEL